MLVLFKRCVVPWPYIPIKFRLTLVQTNGSGAYNNHSRTGENYQAGSPTYLVYTVAFTELVNPDFLVSNMCLYHCFDWSPLHFTCSNRTYDPSYFKELNTASLIFWRKKKQNAYSSELKTYYFQIAGILSWLLWWHAELQLQACCNFNNNKCVQTQLCFDEI